MIYAISDIHGCYDKFMNMLSLIKLSDDDTLYILGDIVDRGQNGLKTILEIADRKNIIALLGNHDNTALAVLGGLMGGCDAERLNSIKEIAKLWFTDGGNTTYTEFRALSKLDKLIVVDYISKMPVHLEIEVAGRKYFLSHSLPEKERFYDDEPLSTDDYIWGEPDYELVYDPKRFFITGHTPTGVIDKEYRGRIYTGNNHIAIDCGAVFGGALGCICLNTGDMFYT